MIAKDRTDGDVIESSKIVISSNLTKRVSQLIKEKEYIIIGFSGLVSMIIICVIIASIAVYCRFRKLKSNDQMRLNQYIQANNQGNLQQQHLPANQTQSRPIYMQCTTNKAD